MSSEHSTVQMDILKRFALFSGCNEQTLKDIQKRLVVKTYERGAYIVKIGDEAKDMFFVAEGTVEYLDSRYHVFSHSNPGDYFGELALLYSIPRTANVRAATDLTLYILTKADFNEIRVSNEAISKFVEATAAKRFNHFKYELVKLAFMPHDVAFSDAQVNAFREAFYRYTQNTGKIDQTGLKRMVFDISGSEFNDHELKAFFNTLDVDKDGVISFDDFLAKIRTLKWILDPKDNEKYSAKILREIEAEEEKKPLWPHFDALSFGVGSLLGAVALGGIAYVGGKLHL